MFSPVELLTLHTLSHATRSKDVFNVHMLTNTNNVIYALVKNRQVLINV